MYRLQWDELDFLECLEVAPVFQEENCSYAYDVRRNEFRLLVVVLLESDAIRFTLRHEQCETPIIAFVLFVRGKIAKINDKRGEFLIFPDSVFAPDEEWHSEATELMKLRRLALGLTLELQIKPIIRFRFS